MSCDLCKQYTEMLPLPDDIIRVVQKFFGHPPHDQGDVMIYSSHVKIDYKKFEYKHDESVEINIEFLCVDQFLIHTITVENYSGMRYMFDSETEESGEYIFNRNSMTDAVCIINELQLKIDFKGEYFDRSSRGEEVYNINPGDVLIYNNTNNLLLDIDMCVYNE